MQIPVWYGKQPFWNLFGKGGKVWYSVSLKVIYMESDSKEAFVRLVVIRYPNLEINRYSPDYINGINHCVGKLKGSALTEKSVVPIDKLFMRI